MNPTVQSSNTFHVAQRRTQSTGATRYRPEDLVAQSPEETKEFAAYLSRVFRQVFDLIYQMQDLLTPAGRLVTGDPTADSPEVPTGASAADLGTGLGLEVSLSRTGRWLVAASICVEIDAGDTDPFTISITVGNAPLAYFGQAQSGAAAIVQIAQQWAVNSQTGDEHVVVRIKKDGGAGASVVRLANSTLSAVWEGA